MPNYKDVQVLLQKLNPVSVFGIAFELKCVSDGKVIGNNFEQHQYMVETFLRGVPVVKTPVMFENDRPTFEALKNMIEHVWLLDMKEMILETFSRNGRLQMNELEERMLVVWGNMTVSDAREMTKRS